MSLKKGLGLGVGAPSVAEPNRVTKQSAIKDGKVSVKKKKPSINLQEWTPIGDALQLPLKLLKLANEEGIEFRWLSAKHIRENHGSHTKGWRVFRVKQTEADDLGLHNYDLAKDADGTIRSGTMILGYKPSEAATHHRKILKEKADRMNNIESERAQRLRNMSGGRAKILEGYEENS
jgi:hypothetical protein